MKIKNLSIALILSVSFAFLGCEKFKESADVTFDSTFSTDMDFDVTEGSKITKAGGSFYETATIDMTTVTLFNDYKEHLQSATTKAITFTVTSITEDTVNLTDVVISISNNGVGIINYPYGNITISTGDSFTIEESQLDLLNDVILAAQGMTVEVSGNSDVAPVQFTWTATIDAEIVANPLQ
jgi:hypothetical protein